MFQFLMKLLSRLRSRLINYLLLWPKKFMIFKGMKGNKLYYIFKINIYEQIYYINNNLFFTSNINIILLNKNK